MADFGLNSDKLYPPPLERAERVAIDARRWRNGIDPHAPTVGVALSGGGIRSATFCLGLFQALARQKLVRRIDFLSTVSGGGYFGSFLGAAFSRDEGTPDTVENDLKDNHSWPVNWLRENGRFLSPNGSGDNWLSAAVALRNWLALHIVLLTFGFLVLGLSALIRADLCTSNSTLSFWCPLEKFFWDHHVVHIWWSPWMVLPLIPFVLIMVPTGTVYWSTQLLPLMNGIRAVVGLVSRSVRHITAEEFANRAQSALTRGFTLGLVSMVVLLGFAVIDSLGQSAYLVWSSGDFKFPALWATLTGAGAGLYGFAAKLILYVENLFGNRKFRLTFDVIALGIALLWAALIVFALSVVSCGFAWRWNLVWDGEHFFPMSGGWVLMMAVVISFVASWVFSRSFGFVNLSSMQQIYAARLARAYIGATNPQRRRHANHNMTALIPGDDLPLESYAPQDHGGPLHLVNVTVNETVSGKTQLERRDRKGLAMAVGPCGMSVGTDAHALWAPPGSRPPMSARHSLLRALWETRERLILPIEHADQSPQVLRKHPRHSAAPPGETAPVQRIEALAFGRWIAISGAAFTTGSGANTHLGLSLLLGLANVRLGYWWNSGVDPLKSGHAARPNFMELASRLITRLLPVQTCLMTEFFARFHGPARQHWYLSDGGHFENTACYELIRRRVPFIICSDAGQDPNYQFGDLANLVRKARTDFGAEIQIIRRDGEFAKDDPDVEYPLPSLEQIVHPRLLDVIGSPEDFPALAETPAAEDGATLRPAVAKRHALLARIHYLDTNAFGWLLLVKPSLMGDESMDVVQYQRTHPLFPQEPTSDQYFDEAQWESYRKLGEHIGAELFTPPAEASDRWSPSRFAPPVVAPRDSAAPAEARPA